MKENNNLYKIPLSERVRPSNINEFVGQKHLLDIDKPLYKLIEEKILQSFIIYGPPASGKTTFAKIYANNLSSKVYQLNANLLNKSDLREIIKNYESNYSSNSSDENNNNLFSQINFNHQNKFFDNKPILIIDEFHRITKPTQDTLLLPLEKGEIILIGTTTENPFFFLQPALRSRIFIYEFFDLSFEEIKKAIYEALERDSKFSKYKVKFDEDSLNSLIKQTNDLRKILNILEIILENKLNKIKDNENLIFINNYDINNFLQNNFKYNNNYNLNDVISAYIKSMRGSDPDAAIYYLTLMLQNGEDPEFICRRLIIFASEDIGLSYPYALPIATATLEAIKNIGMPEGGIILSETTILFSLLKKNNSTYKAYQNALEFIKKGNYLNIPHYLRGGGRKLYEKFFNKYSPTKNNSEKNNSEYLYPHDFPDHYVEQKYLSDDVKFYFPENIGFEAELIKWFNYLKEKYKKGNS